MELHEKIDCITTHKDLADFIEALRSDLLVNRNEWENPDLERFLEAMAAWIRSMEQVYKNTGKEFSDQPRWRMVADRGCK